MTTGAVRRDVNKPVAPCPLCDAEAGIKFTKFSHQYFRCSCGFVFIWPNPSQQELNDLYRKYGEEYWTNERMVNFAFSPTKSWREVRFLSRLASGGTLLDIGCSTGSFVKAAREAGFEAEGVDICVPAVQLGQKMGLPLYALDILSESPGKQYDLVTMWATLEHLPDPRYYLRRAWELLKPDGLLFVSVPNYAGITQKILGKWDRYVGSDHLNYFTPRVLRQGLQEEGFSFKKATTYGFNPILILKDLKDRGRRSLASEDLQVDEAVTLRLKHSPMLRLQRTAERILNLFSAGDAIAICAQRNDGRAT